MKIRRIAIIVLFIVSLSLSFLFFQNQNKKIIKNIIFYPTENKTESIYIAQFPSLKQVFSENHTWTATLSAEKLTTIVATGDIIPARSVNFQTIKHQDFNWPYLKTADFLKSADITFANLEAPLLADCPITNEGMIFCGDKRHIEGLKFSGVDIVNIANNHYGNHGTEGISESNQTLTLNDIKITGNNKITYIKNNGLTFAFVGFNEIGYKQDGLGWMEEESVKNLINKASATADVVITTFHWGTEYTTNITESQKYFAHLAIDNGADLVIGNHPHWIQPLEIYKGKLIAYAHGNFIFDQEWSQETKTGMVGKYTFYENKLIDVEYKPVFIEEYGQPKFLEDGQRDRILKNLERISF